jgi:L-ribulose-5-phosphate 4-epimerase
VATPNEDASGPPSAPRDWSDERNAVLDGARAMYRDGLVVASSGNVSMRCGTSELLAITATGKDYEHLDLDQVVVVDFEGEPVIGDAIPSTEMLMHAAVYRARPDVRAVMHTHSVYASAAAVAATPLPPLIDEMVVYLGGAIQVSDYTFPGTEELADNVVRALGERNAALIRNHGMIGVGRTVPSALSACQLTERLAHIYAGATALGNAQPLPADAVETELELYRMRQAVEGQG